MKYMLMILCGCSIVGCDTYAMQRKPLYEIGDLVPLSAGAYTSSDVIKIGDYVLVVHNNDFKIGRIDALHGEFYEVTTYVHAFYKDRRGGSLFAKNALYKLPEKME